MNNTEKDLKKLIDIINQLFHYLSCEKGQKVIKYKQN